MFKIRKSSRLKKYLLITLGVSACFYFSGAIILNEIESHYVEIIEKSPLFPASDYEYITTEETFYSIDKVITEVPAYFRTDFASIPKVLWFIDAPYRASFVYPAIWHDYMYACSKNKTRKEIDDAFFWLLRFEQNSLWKSLKMYIAVRIFGGKYFKTTNSCSDILLEEESNKKQYDKENVNHG